MNSFWFCLDYSLQADDNDSYNNDILTMILQCVEDQRIEDVRIFSFTIPSGHIRCEHWRHLPWQCPYFLRNGHSGRLGPSDTVMAPLAPSGLRFDFRQLLAWGAPDLGGRGIFSGTRWHILFSCHRLLNTAEFPFSFCHWRRFLI